MPYKDPLDPRAREARMRYYHKNRTTHYERNNKARAEKQKYIRSVKETPCTDCGVQYYWVCMDFDHVRGEKVASLSRLHNHSWKKIKEEISKCEVVCANCHRLRTHIRGSAGHPTGSNPGG